MLGVFFKIRFSKTVHVTPEDDVSMTIVEAKKNFFLIQREKSMKRKHPYLTERGLRALDQVAPRGPASLSPGPSWWHRCCCTRTWGRGVLGGRTEKMQAPFPGCPWAPSVPSSAVAKRVAHIIILVSDFDLTCILSLQLGWGFLGQKYAEILFQRKYCWVGDQKVGRELVCVSTKKSNSSRAPNWPAASYHFNTWTFLAAGAASLKGNKSFDTTRF